MNIIKARVRNYKSFVDSGEINVDAELFGLIGQNNTGKSAIMDAIQCMFPSSKKSITALDFHKGSSQITIELWFDGVTQKYLENNLYEDKIIKQKNNVDKMHFKYKESPTEKNKENIEKEINKVDEIRKSNYSKYIQKYNIKEDLFYIKLISTKGERISNKFYLSDKRDITEQDIKKLLPQLKVIPAIRDPKNESTAGTNSYLKELIQMIDDEMQTNIKIDGTNISYKELNRAIAKETKKRCTSIEKEITNFYNQAIGTNDYEVIIHSDVNISKGTTFTTKIKDTNTDIESDILNCGTGYQSMLILAILETYVKISQRQNSYILLIEEPEVYLHPTLQRKMIDTLVDISQTNQVIFTSHSPITVSKLSKEQIKLVKKEDGIARIENINPKNVIEELGIKPDDILSYQGIIFVEGKDDKIVFELLLEKLNTKLKENINIIVAGACQDLKFFATAELLINNRFNIPTLIVRDIDTNNPSTFKENFLKEITKKRQEPLSKTQEEKLRDSIVGISRYSLEGHFIDENLLDILKIDDKDIKSTVKCYECQFESYTNKLYKNKINKNIISTYYQPKKFLEGFLDSYKASQTEKIKGENEKYENKWKEYPLCATCEESDIDTFIKTRQIINCKTKELKINKKDFMIEAIKSKSLETIKQTKLNEILQILEEFLVKVEAL